MADLEAASIADVRDFFKTYYVPEQRDARARRRLRHRRKRSELVKRYLGRVPKSDTAGPARHSRRAAADQGTARARRRERAAAGGRRRAPHHLRRASRLVSAAHRVEGALGRPELAHLPQARLREAAGARRVRRGNIIEDPNLFYAVAIVQRGRTTEEATNALIAELDRLQARADHARRSCSRPRISSRATTSSAASRTRTRRSTLGARGRDPRRHHDRRWRVRRLHEHDRRRRAARGAEVLHAGEPAGDHAHAEGVGRRPGSCRSDAAACRTRRRDRRGAACVAPRGDGAGRGLAVGAAPRPLPAREREVPALPGQDALERPAGHRGGASRAAGGQPAADRPGRRRAGSRPTSRVSRRSSPRFSIRARRRGMPSRSRSRSIRSAASSAPAPAAISRSSTRW